MNCDGKPYIQTRTVRKATGAGTQYTVEFLLNSHWKTVVQTTPRPIEYIVSISDSDAPFDVGQNGIYVKPGEDILFKVSASQVNILLRFKYSKEIDLHT